jgi:predicted translin family RNA/ssDNA-binding protein
VTTKELIKDMVKDKTRLEAIYTELKEMKCYDWDVLDPMRKQIDYINERINKLENKLQHEKDRKKLKLPDNVYMVDFKARKLVA